MKLVSLIEDHPLETRVPLTVNACKKLIKNGMNIFLPQGFGKKINQEDQAFQDIGVTMFPVNELDQHLASADMVVRIRAPKAEDIKKLKEGSIHASFLDPFGSPELLDHFNERKISAISFEMIPRTTLAQKMDFLSSQANLAGYVAVLRAANEMHKIFPMMMTAAGTITPSKVFVIGAGVAGLQAIATAKRLGAKVEAFDTRPVVKEQVESLGAKFVEIDLGDTGQTSGGYAKELTPEQIKMQQELMAKTCEQSDVVITTAQLFGRPAPTIITKEMVERMKPGSVIVDLAVESGGNVDGSVVGESVDVNGVLIVGGANFAGKVSVHASDMFANNVVNFIETFWSENSFNLSTEDEIISGCLMTKDGSTINPMFLDIMKRSA